jgi:transcription antitermination factor NusB
MSNRRDIRTLALQTLYQLDARGEEALEAVRRSVDEAPGDKATHEQAVELALGAWQMREAADELATELAPTWPPSRQPAIDRAVIRLAYHEMAAGITPPKVAINEAVELAKQFSTEKSGPFVNGVLDKMMHRLAATPQTTATDDPSTPPTTGDAWLDDAL